MGLVGLPPLCQDGKHHWHQGTSDGREGEILTSAPCWYPVHCCHCGANAKAVTDDFECYKKTGCRGPAVDVKKIGYIQQSTVLDRRFY